MQVFETLAKLKIHIRIIFFFPKGVFVILVALIKLKYVKSLIILFLTHLVLLSSIKKWVKHHD